ncbi:hypothetical protein [Alkalihalobacillus trypoxylicola]|uniref:Uncharacterized protein n=1 Tax=Alkalihalobacillus trypoxylicola TaxID=519424 RepID=A0A161P670_9BACI|nr:hypothetical protein [Alkalihalobacillus trypoxylicola]KYG26571.1 hypothetical protein AZF04_12220 [Alkalihalobacillus trypoxylicola]
MWSAVKRGLLALIIFIVGILFAIVIYDPHKHHYLDKELNEMINEQEIRSITILDKHYDEFYRYELKEKEFTTLFESLNIKMNKPKDFYVIDFDFQYYISISTGRESYSIIYGRDEHHSGISLGRHEYMIISEDYLADFFNAIEGWEEISFD